MGPNQYMHFTFENKVLSIKTKCLEDESRHFESTSDACNNKRGPPLLKILYDFMKLKTNFSRKDMTQFLE